MATNLALDDSLVAEAQSIGEHKTKKAVVTEALKEYIQRRKQQEILKLFGKIEYAENHDYKQQRQVQ
uniref:Type II toxin-antitoxin system VapB family antitoxin n=1 Tax=uncultured Thiotrichaceae bacterium TaxID=298394 RepID=A0A6S6SHC2_9GAMM|nr:MAG: Type II toxin-antitoxin system VapB family antitoxin [uncultured Thiotrichaceae bacterium]